MNPASKIAIHASPVTIVINRQSARRDDLMRYRLMRPARGSGRHNLPGEPRSSSGKRVEVVKACTRSDRMVGAPSVFIAADVQMLSEIIQVCVKTAAEPGIPRNGLKRMENAGRAPAAL